MISRGSDQTDPTDTFQDLQLSGNVIRQELERDEATKLRILNLVVNAHPVTAEFPDCGSARGFGRLQVGNLTSL
jgi:hypothetical protein